MNSKMLSGHELVGKGFTKIETTLPEVGLKYVQPNGTWLEQKQIQSALEARKHLIEVARIEKSGTLSIAIWKDELMLAEVIQKVGGHWQYMGHNIGKQLYLYPEETLFLMEVNCLQLIHNDLKVSLQQAYSLLLLDQIALLKYKVYASLSRIGYRLFRHKKKDITDFEVKIKLNTTSDLLNGDPKIENENATGKTLSEIADTMENNDCEKNAQNILFSTETSTLESLSKPKTYSTIKKNRTLMHNRVKLLKLKNRQMKPCFNGVIHQYLDSIPDLTQKGTIAISVPDTRLVPMSMNLKKSSYVVNLERISNKPVESASTSSQANIFSVDEEVNGTHIRRLRQESNSQSSSPNIPNIRFNFQNIQFQPSYYMYRPRPNLFYNFNMLFQRPFLPRWYCGQPFRFCPPNQQVYVNSNMNFFDNNTMFNNFANTRRKRKINNLKKYHLDGIKRLAFRLKQIVTTDNSDTQNIQSLQRIINTYNTRYKTKLILTNDFDIVCDETIVDTIELDDEDESNNKKPRVEEDQTFHENLQVLKQFVFQLRCLENEGKATPRHRRALSRALKTLNKCYNEEYYVNDVHDIINSRQIDLDSHSDSDCVVEEVPKVTSKKLRNPFNILKRLSEKLNDTHTEAHSSSSHTDQTVVMKNKMPDNIFDTVPKHWLPDNDDFGSVEIVTQDTLSDTRQEEFIYDFFKMQPNKYNNWLELKQSFFNSLEEAIVEFHGNSKSLSKDNKSIVKPGDCTDMASVLNKLRIIKAETKIGKECRLSIDFDVYNRNVQNFKKSKPPDPHFHIICLEESSNLPTSVDVATIRAAYNDNISIFFAVVGEASISYLQMKPTDLPIYIASNV